MKSRILVVIIVVMAVFNGALLLKYYLDKTGSARSDMSVTTLTLGEETALIEHDLEGRNLGEYSESQILSERWRLSDATRRKLVILFRGDACDRCLDSELSIFMEMRKSVESAGLDVIILFAQMNPSNYSRITKLFGIEEYSIYCAEENPFKINTMNPISILLSEENRMIYVNLSDYRNADKSRRFYDKALLCAGAR